MDSEADEVIEQIDSEEEDIEAGTPLYQIRSYPSDPDLETLHLRWKRGDLIIPKFQRGFVWKHAQASKLIESFLMGLPVPGIFVFVQSPGWGQASGATRQLVVDGQQRLRSVFGFFENKLPPNDRPFPLTGVGEQWAGKDFNSLEHWEKRQLLTSVLRVVNIEQAEPQQGDSGVYQIFERLNTGGTALTPQEIRNSTHQGPFNDMLIEANKNPDWRAIFGSPHPDNRMRDVELLVRFLALHEEFRSYAEPMKEFINTYMGKRKMETNPAESREAIANTVRRIVESLGPRPFHVRRGLNAAVCDSVMVAFAKSKVTPDNIKERYEELKGDSEFIAATTATTTKEPTVTARLNLAQRVLFE